MNGINGGPNTSIVAFLDVIACGFGAIVLLVLILPVGENSGRGGLAPISKYVEFSPKKKAILCHKSQSPDKFLEASEIMNRYRAAQCNLPKNSFAEAFRANNSFPFADLRNLLPPAPILRPFYKNNTNSLI